MSIQVDTTNWIKGKHYPTWMNEIGLSMISKGYLLPDEDVFDAFKRVSRAAANLLKQMEWFGHLTSGKSHSDFFSTRVTDYSKSTADWSDL